MTRFEWDGLRLGDVVFVHHSVATHRRAEGGTVAFLEVRPRRGNKVGVRLGAGERDEVVWPSWVESHRAPIEAAATCWRCGDRARGRRGTPAPDAT